jgi:hypothetical protein
MLETRVSSCGLEDKFLQPHKLAFPYSAITIQLSAPLDTAPYCERNNLFQQVFPVRFRARIVQLPFLPISIVLQIAIRPWA